MLNKKNLEVICVDDDTEVLEVTSSYVSDLGYTPVGFDNVSAAVEYINDHTNKVLIILSDLRMDNENGFDFKRALASTASDIPFIIITGYWTKEMSAEAMEIGVDAFLEKPIEVATFEKEVNKFAEKRLLILEEEAEMIEGFLEESTPMLDEIEQLILELEEAPDSDQTLSVYFRLMHTIKGTASCVGLNQLGNYTHTYEDFVGELRNKVIPVNTKTINVLLGGLDDLKHFFSTIQETGADSHISIEGMVKKFDPTSFAGGLEEQKTEVVATKDDSKSKKKDEDKMTVSMRVLNEFMEESGELTVIRSSILKTVKKIEAKFRGDKDIELLNELLDGMYNVTSNVQGKITEMRKVSLKNTFRPFKRLVRDLSTKLDKQVDFTIQGEELSVDNVVAKLFSNTLIHVLRNSLDHGLENTIDRAASGKSAMGKLAISVSEVGEDIVLKIDDDGKGINPEIIRSKAIEKGLYSEYELAKMSELEIINIIFDPGFSTAEQVSDLSGRGVGMDMVRGSFEAMGGAVFVQSKAGQGSQFTLKVPIPKSVLIINTLLVYNNNQPFIFHMDEVSEVIRHEVDTPTSKMYDVDGKQIINHNDEMIQLISLASVLGLPQTEDSANEVTNIVVLRIGDYKFGVTVDEIHEFEEVVSRKISDQITSVDLYYGASLLGTGEVAMIISAEGFAGRANLNFDKDSHGFNLNDVAESDKAFVDEVEEFMLFKYTESDSLCIELDDVERLETISSNQLEMVGNNVIIKYLNKVLPIVDPAFTLGLTDRTDLTNLAYGNEDIPMEIIVVNVQGTFMGVFVHELNEIKFSLESMNVDTVNMEGLKGSVFIEEKTICVLDLEYVFSNFKNKGIHKPGLDFNPDLSIESEVSKVPEFDKAA